MKNNNQKFNNMYIQSLKDEEQQSEVNMNSSNCLLRTKFSGEFKGGGGQDYMLLNF
jgi:hypothetical protein